MPPGLRLRPGGDQHPRAAADALRGAGPSAFWAARWGSP